MTDSQFYADFGRRLALSREDRGYTQAQFARALGLPQSTLAGYEAGARKMPLHLAWQAARTLKVGMGEMFDDREQPG